MKGIVISQLPKVQHLKMEFSTIQIIAALVFHGMYILLTGRKVISVLLCQHFQDKNVSVKSSVLPLLPACLTGGPLKG